MSYLLETVDSPKHIGSLLVFKPKKGQTAATIKRFLKAHRETAVAPPFNYVPVFSKLSLPKWAESHNMDMDYHIRQAALPKPGNAKQLNDLVMDLHAGILDHSRPGWIITVIEGLENQQFAIYLKIHHAYIDGASAVMRMDALMSKSAKDLTIQPMWVEIDKTGDLNQQYDANQQYSANVANDLEKTLAKSFKTIPKQLLTINRNMKAQRQTTREVISTMYKSALEAGGIAKPRQAPLPFSAPKSIFNNEVHAQRRLGIGGIKFADFKAQAKQAGVSINELALALVGDALENYAETYNSAVDKALVAVCPLGLRKEGDTSASTQIAALAIKLGEPGVDIATRLSQVHESSVHAKEDAQSMSRQALMTYLIMVGGLAELLDRPPFNEYLPPLTNVNVSNVAGPREDLYLSGAKLVKSIPLSTLAGGTAINITFFSIADRMEYAVLADAGAVPDAQQIADNIAAAFERLAAKPVSKTKGKTRQATQSV